VNCVKALRTVDLRGRGRSYPYSKSKEQRAGSHAQKVANSNGVLTP
jgi:hypothetical protein